MDLKQKPSVRKSTYAGRTGVTLENKNCVLFVQNIGGMTPLFALKTKNDLINSAWVPHFRGSPHKQFSYEDKTDVDYWSHNILFEASGTFPCSPSFGSGENISPDTSPPHGHTANLEWELAKTGITEFHTYAKWKLSAPSPWTLEYTKYDMLSMENPTHTLLLEVENTGTKPQPINLAWHTTLGTPLICDGGLLSCSSDNFATAPLGSEFDTTGNFKRDANFNSLSEIPLLDGTKTDGTKYQLHTGFSDLLTAQMPTVNDENNLGWASFINPHLNIGYLSISPKVTLEDMVPASFCNFWMQQGGREFAPWADENNSPDRTKALGMEMGIGYFANGLAESLNNPEFLSRPTYITLNPGQKVKFSVVNLMFQPTFTGILNEFNPVTNGVEVGNGKQKQIINCDLELKDLSNIINNNENN